LAQVSAMVRLSVEECWHWWQHTLKSPRYVCAPMVLQSELAFRMLIRKHGVDLCYTPMLPVKAFLSCPPDGDEGDVDEETGGPATQADFFSTCAQDRPLIVQFGGNNAEELLTAALLVQDHVDAVDINFGCPQRCARLGGYGAFLMDDPKKVRRLVMKLVDSLKVPVTAKMRILPEISDTVAFALRLQEAGVAAVGVHGRLRTQRHHEGLADWNAIAAVKAALSIPVIANGNILTAFDADRCMESTGADAVMSATTLLINPRLFAKGDSLHETFEGRVLLALEYLNQCKQHPDGVLPRMISDHLLAILRPDLDVPEAVDFKTMFKAFRRLTQVWEYEQLVHHLAGNHDRICCSLADLREGAISPKNNKPGKAQRDKNRRRAARRSCQQKLVNVIGSTWASLLALKRHLLAFRLVSKSL